MLRIMHNTPHERKGPTIPLFGDRDDAGAPADGDSRLAEHQESLPWGL